MNFNETTCYSRERVTIENVLPSIGRDKIIKSIIQGLNSSPKTISSMFFYDERGSELFEDITRLSEYYPTRKEMALLREVSATMGGKLHDLDIVELGSGDCSKISILLKTALPFNLESIGYIPVDVSEEAIRKSAQELSGKFEGLTIYGIAADFMTQLHLLPSGRKRLFCFLGGTLGNLNIEEQNKFLSTLGQVMQEEDEFLLGVDMIKPIGILERAYNDSLNVTAEFNRNILNVVNDVTGTNFVPEDFEHIAFYNREHSRIEMHLRSKKDLVLTSPHCPHAIHIHQGELIHTENSHKFSMTRLTKQLENAGLRIDSRVQDSKKWFTLLCLSRNESKSNA